MNITGTQAPSIISESQVKKVLAKYDGEPLLFLRHSGLPAEISQIPEVAAANLEISFLLR
ncbi:hypothetical protein RQN30_02535 [Arcanobacterium hippocoleae]